MRVPLTGYIQSRPVTPVPGVLQGPEPGLTGRWVWELGFFFFFHSLQPLVVLLFPSKEERILASQLAEGW